MFKQGFIFLRAPLRKKKKSGKDPAVVSSLSTLNILVDSFCVARSNLCDIRMVQQVGGTVDDTELIKG